MPMKEIKVVATVSNGENLNLLETLYRAFDQLRHNIHSS